MQKRPQIQSTLTVSVQHNASIRAREVAGGRSGYAEKSARPWVRNVAKILIALFIFESTAAILPAYAQGAPGDLATTPHSGALAGQRPIMDAANNGVPIVLIAPPSAGGVSRNQYEQFNVNPNGLILNNSSGHTQTQLGGWVVGNPQLGITPARIILNEVVSGNPSQLRGTIEVAGQRADIVVANPNGITCNGCGFLNTGRASLATGAPQLGADGALSGFDVRQGQLTVGGLGLNASNLEQLDLIARGIVIEGEVWARNLNVIAGTNKVLYGTLQAAVQTGNGTAPGFAIDIKDVGGMYANQIYMVATEQGLGVNSTGRMAALQGNLVLSANGDLRLKDSYARQDVRIASTGRIELNGQTQSDGAMEATAGGTFAIRGVIDAQGRLALAASAIDNQGTVAQRNGEGIALTAVNQFSNSGVLFSTGEPRVDAGSIVDTGGQLLSAADLRLQAGQIGLTGTRLMTDGSVRFSTAEELSAQDASINAAGSIAVVAGSAISNADGTWQAGNDISLAAASIANRRSVLLASGRIDADAATAIENTDGKLLAAGNVRLAGVSLNNDRGQIVTDAEANVALNGALHNASGLISAKGSIALNSGSGAITNTAGTIIADGGLDIASGNLFNAGGVIAARAGRNQTLSIQAAGIENRGGVIDAAGALKLHATGTIDNAGGALQSGTDTALADGTARIASASLVNNGGRVVARDALTVSTGTLSNDKAGISQGVVASTTGSVSLTAAAASNAGGLITAAGDTSIRSATLDNTGGELSSGSRLGINTGGNAFINDGGSLLAGADVDVHAGTLRSNALAGGQAATIAASGDVVISAAGLGNDGSTISAGRDIRIATGSGTLTNQGGAIEAQRMLEVSAGAVDTRAGRMVANDALSIRAAGIQATDARITANGPLVIDTAGALINARGVIASDGTVSIAAAELDNTDGTVSAGINADVRLGSGLLANSRGSLIGTQALALQSGEIRNEQGVIASGSALSLDTQNRALDNTAGQIVAYGDLRIDSARFDNDGGTAASIGGTLFVNTHGSDLSSNSGRLQAEGDVGLSTGNFSNRNGLVSGAAVSAQTGTFDNTSGQLIAASDLAVTSQVLNNAAGLLQAVGNVAIDTQGQALTNSGSGATGGIIAGGTLGIQAGTLDNKAGNIASNGNQTLAISGDMDNRTADGQAGQIVSNAGTTISVGNLLNTGGYIGTLGNVSVNTALLDNRAGQVAANGDATFAITTLDNSIDGGIGGAIDAGSISVTGTTLNNTGGAMRSANDASFSLTSLNNSAGVISAKKALSMTAGSIANSDGSMVGDMSVTITTSSQSLGGTIASANDVTLNINGNYSNSGLLSAQRNLTLNAANITNSGTLKAGDTLTANTGDLANSGEISAHTTNINASGTLTNTATGLIDGVNTNINAGTTDNTGRIYGDVLRINGNTVNNSGTGTIAARNTLAIGAQQLNNTGSALIYSLGNIAMAGSLDAGGSPNGEMAQLVNASSRIEAAGNIDMSVANLVNRNDALTTRIETSVEAINKTYIQPEGSVTKYDASVLGWDPTYKENSGRYVLPSATYPFDQFGAVRMKLANESYCIDWWSEFSPPCETVHIYAPDHPVWALFDVPPPDFSDLTVPVMPADQGMFGNCTSYDPLTESTWRNNYGSCGAYWEAKDAYDQAVAQRTMDAESQLDSRISIFNNDVLSRAFEVWNEYQITSRSISETVIDSTSPAQIIAGGGINIYGSGTKLNDNSQVVAGGAINIGGTSVINQAEEGTRSITESGQVRYRRIEHHGGWNESYEVELHPWSPTTGAPIVETFELPSYSYTSYAGNQTATRNLSVLTSAPSTASAAASLSAIGQSRSISAGTLNAVLPTGVTIPGASTAPPIIVRVDATGSGAQASDVILSTLPRLDAPSNSLFAINPQLEARYLVETDPRFTNYRTFLSSDYMLQALNRDPERQLKRYGDGFFEQQLVNDQILALTGRRFLTGYSDTQAEYQALMDAGIAFAQQYQLSPGVALSAEQMLLLTTDIVWLTEQTVTLADGQKQQVLVPQVYLRRPRDGDLQQSGSLIAGSDIRITTETDLANSGTISADRSATLLAGRDLVNQGGRISGQDIVARAGNDLKNLSGVIQGTGANSDVTLLAGRDIVLQTRTIATATQATATTAASSRVSVDRIATVQGGNVRLEAGRDLIGSGSDVQAITDLIAAAGRDIKVSAVTGSYEIDIQRGGDTRGRTGYIKEASVTNQVAAFAAGNNVALVAGTGDVGLKGTDITAGNNAIVQGANVSIEAVKDRQVVDVQNVRRRAYDRAMVDDESLAGGNIVAGKNLTVRATGTPMTAQDGDGVMSAAGTGDVRLAGAYLSAKEGQATIIANNNVSLDTITTEHRTANESYSKTKGLLSKKVSEKSSLTEDQLANGSAVIGNTVVIQSGQNTAIRGSTVLGSGDVVITAQEGNVAISAAESATTESHFRYEKKSGISSSKVGIGVTIGKSEQKANFDGAVTTQSENRSVVGATGGNVIITAGKNVTVKGSDMIAGAAKGDMQNATGHIDILGQNITIEPGQDTIRTKATAEAKQRGMTVALVGTMVDTARNLEDVQKKEGKFARFQGTVDELAHSGATTPQVAVSFDRSQSSSQTTTNDLVNSGSTLIAAGDVRVRATGDGGKDAGGRASNGDITITGSTIHAGGLVQLDAQRNITLQPSTDQYSQSTQSSSKSTHFSTAMPSIGDTGRAMTGGPNNSGVGQFPYRKTNISDSSESAASVQSASMITGNDVILNSRSGDIRIAGSGVTAVRDIGVVAHMGKIDIVSGEDRRSHQEEHRAKTIGDLGAKGSTGTSNTVGVHKESSTLDSRESQQNTVRSAFTAGRDLTIDAKKDITVQGADLRAGQDLTLIGQNIQLDPGQDTSLVRQTSTMHQAGNTIGASGWIVDAVKAAEQAVNAYEKNDDKRLAALYGAKAGATVYSGLQGKGSQPTDGIEAPKNSAGAAIKITVSVGSKSASSKSEVGSTTNQGSTLTAGQTASLIATGSGDKDANGNAVDGDISARGTRIAGTDVILAAARDISLQSTQDITKNSSENSSSNSSIGVGFGLGGQQNGFTLELAAAKAEGRANGESSTNQNTQIAATHSIILDSGRDTTLMGAQIKGDNISANVGRDLSIESLQDTDSYHSQQKNSGFALSLCIPPFCYGATVSGTVSAGKAKIDSDYQSVTEQSGLYAGEGGFDITVKGNTDLKGAVIASAAEERLSRLVTGTLTTSDIENTAEFETSTSSLSLSYTGGYTGRDGSITAPGNEIPGTRASESDKGILASGTPIQSVTANLASNAAANAVPGQEGKSGGTTRSAISAGTIIITDEEGQQQKTGQTTAETLASLNRDVATANGSIDKIFDQKEVEREQEYRKVLSDVAQQAAPLVYKQVGNYLKDKPTEVKVAVHALVGGLLSKAVGGEFGTGAAGAAAATLAVEAFGNDILAIEGMSNADKEALVQLVALAVGKVGAAAAGADSGSSNAASVTAKLAAEHNFLKHTEAAIFRERLDGCEARKGGCPEDERRAIINEYFAISARNIQELDICTMRADQACLNRIKNEIASSGELPRSLVGQEYVIFSGKQTKGQDAVALAQIHIKDIEKGRQAICGNLGVTECDAKILRARGDASVRAAGLVLAVIGGGVLSSAEALAVVTTGMNVLIRTGQLAAAELAALYRMGPVLYCAANANTCVNAADIALQTASGANAPTAAVLPSKVVGKTVTNLVDDVRVGANTIEKQALAKTLNNFYRDGASPDLIQQTFNQAAISSTHNVAAKEVILGKYIAGSSDSYDEVARRQGATYFSMSDWTAVQNQLGPDQMWNINKAFLDQQIAQGKIFIFTANPASADIGSFTYKEFKHLQESGYKIVPDISGFYRAIK